VVEQIEARFLCYPVNDFVKGSDEDSFCWREFNAQIAPSLLSPDGEAPCPVCGNTIAVKPVTGMGIFMRNVKESENTDGS